MNYKDFILAALEEMGVEEGSADISERSAKQAEPKKENPKLMQLLAQIEQCQKKEALGLRKIKEAILDGEEEVDVTVQINRFLSWNERYYLIKKELRPFCCPADKTVSTELVDVKGTFDYFPGSVKRIGPSHYEFHLPHMRSKQKYERHLDDGKAMRYHVSHLLREFAEEKGALEKPKNPAVIFVHHMKEKWFAMDPDNVDCKAAIDGMQHYLIPEDNLLCITLHEFGIPDSEAFTEIHVADRADLLEIQAEILERIRVAEMHDAT